MGREEGEQCRSKRHCFGFVFFFKEKKCNLEEEKNKIKFGSGPKMGYDSYDCYLYF
jgi:hypothetical protein